MEHKIRKKRINMDKIRKILRLLKRAMSKFIIGKDIFYLYIIF